MGEKEPASKKEWNAIEKRLKGILEESDLSQLTTKGVRKTLESEFGVSLSSTEGKAWIKEKINAFVEEGAAAPEPSSSKPPDSRKRKAPSGTGPGTDADNAEIPEDPGHPPISSDLADILGVQRATRFRITKLLWIYIKKHGLQDPDDKRYILCDAKLKKVFGGQDRIFTFAMSKYIGRHILPEDEEEDDEADGADDGDASSKPRKRATPAPKGVGAKGAKGAGGSAAGYKGTPELAAFVGEETNNRFAITKRLWAHIKANGLQNPSDKRRIMCDDTLKRLFKVDEMTAFSMSKHVSAHFQK